jgi:hypothetical protein
VIYRDEERLRDARARYFADNDFGDGGGYDEKWVKIKAGPLAFWFPNSDARRRAVRYHDLHHVLAGYQTDWVGEAEIGAWEVGSSCADHWAAWYLNLVVFFVGFFIAPRRIWAAFVRGRRTRNLYREPWENVRLEDALGAWRQRLGLDAPSYESERGDVLAFAGFGAVAFLCWATNSLLLLLPFVLAFLGLRAIFA